MRPIRRLRRLTVLPLAVALFSPVPFAAPAAAATPARYTVTDLGSLGTGDYSVATAVNNAGTVVGYSNPTSLLVHGFRWSAGTLTDLGAESGGYSWANAINDAGQVAGTSVRTVGGYGYPVRWSADGLLQDLGGPVVNRLGVGNGIDPAGRVVGGQRPADSQGNPIAILYDQAGNQTLLGNPPESLGAANGINARGQIVGSSEVPDTLPSGSHAVTWKGGAPTDIGTVDGLRLSQANAVNAAGQVVGTADPGCTPCGSPRAWIWQAGGRSPRWTR